MDKKPRRWRKYLVRGALVVLFALFVCYLGFTGPYDLSRYPPPGDSPYRLPWPAGTTYLCTQSNRGIVSHRGFEEFAFDFYMPVGSDVCAARGGTVNRVVQEHDGAGWRRPNNLILIDHGDGTFGAYYHLRQDGCLVVPGQRVKRGQKIAFSGNVGHSLAPHLHFHVQDARGTTLPVSFGEVGGRGVPRLGLWYRSANEAPEEDEGP